MASTVVEIGITIPALKAIVVVHAERYGASTLHQIRGRVARHGGEGFYYLYLPQEASEDSMQRMRLMEEISDGFKLAEADMEMRGFGDLSDASRAAWRDQNDVHRTRPEAARSGAVWGIEERRTKKGMRKR